MNGSASWVGQALVCMFLAILFIQSGLDKVLARGANREYIQGVFAKTALARFAGAMLVALTALELLAGALSAGGLLQVVFFRQTGLAFAGAAASGVTLCCLFFGQRVAKDYGGAAGLVPYFLVALTGIALSA